MTVKEAVLGRRSVRAYKSKKVSREDIEAVMLAGKYAPSALGDGSRMMIAITDEKVLAALNAAVASTVDEATRKRIEGRTKDGKFDFFYGAPVLIVVADDPAVYAPAADCACCLENMFLQAYELGLGTCWINQLVGRSDDPAVSSVLTAAGMKNGYRVYGCCALGYADGEPAAKLKTNETIIV